MRRARAGFTLAELLVAIVMAALLFVTLASLYTAGIRYQVQTFDRTAVGNRALMAQRSIQRALEQATLIDIDRLPVPGNGNTLFLGINVYPGTQSAAGAVASRPLLPPGLFPGAAARYASFCVTAPVTGNSTVCPPGYGHPNPATPRRCLVTYQGPWPLPNLGLVCGAAPPAGHLREVLAGPIELNAGAPFFGQAFFRPANNVVRVDLLVRRDRDPARGTPELRFPIQMEMRARLSAN